MMTRKGTTDGHGLIRFGELGVHIGGRIDPEG